MPPLRIGINALFRGKPTGVANYIINLVRYLARLDKENEYFIVVSRENREYFDLSQDNFHELLCSVKTENPFLRRIWEQTVLPGLVHEKKIDILHCPVNIVPLSLRCKSIVTFLDCQYFHSSSKNTFLRKNFHAIFMRLSQKKADLIITISQSMKEEIKRYFGRTNGNIYVTYLGQDVGEPGPPATPRDIVERNYGISRKYLLFVGFPHYRKNLTGLLKGFALALKKLRDDYELVICGDIETKIESDYMNIVRTSEELGMKDRVKLVGYLQNRDLHDLMARAELFVFPSFYEGFGIPVIEAMACGTPVLVSDIPVMHEIAGDAGFYVNPYDVNDIAQGICTLLSDDDLRARMSRDGKKAASRFTWKNLAQKTLDCYHQIDVAQIS